MTETREEMKQRHAAERDALYVKVELWTMCVLATGILIGAVLR